MGPWHSLFQPFVRVHGCAGLFCDSIAGSRASHGIRRLSPMLGKRFKAVAAHSLAIFACLIMVIPFYLIVTNSLKTKADASSMSPALPAALHVENFSTVIDQGKLAISFFNSMVYASGSTI